MSIFTQQQIEQFALFQEKMVELTELENLGENIKVSRMVSRLKNEWFSPRGIFNHLIEIEEVEALLKVIRNTRGTKDTEKSKGTISLLRELESFGAKIGLVEVEIIDTAYEQQTLDGLSEVELKGLELVAKKEGTAMRKGCHLIINYSPAFVSADFVLFDGTEYKLTWSGESEKLVTFETQFDQLLSRCEKKLTEKPTVRPYLRASTSEQNPKRAIDSLTIFAKSHGYDLDYENSASSFYIDTGSGAKATRPELTRLLRECNEGDIILVEKVDRLSRLSLSGWNRLKETIKNAGLYLVVIDHKETHQSMHPEDMSEQQMGMFHLIASLLVDVAAGAAHADYLTRRERAAQERAKTKFGAGRTGRKADSKKVEAVESFIRRLHAGEIKTKITKENCKDFMPCGKSTFDRIKTNYEINIVVEAIKDKEAKEETLKSNQWMTDYRYDLLRDHAVSRVGCEMFLADKTAEEVNEIIQVSEEKLEAIRIQAINKKAAPMFYYGESLRDVAEKLGVSQKDLKNTYLSEIRFIVRRDLANGLYVSDIAAKYKVSNSYVLERQKELKGSLSDEEE